MLVATRIVEVGGAEVGVDEVAEPGVVVAVVHVGEAGRPVVGVAGQPEADPVPDLIGGQVEITIVAIDNRDRAALVGRAFGSGRVVGQQLAPGVEGGVIHLPRIGIFPGEGGAEMVVD